MTKAKDETLEHLRGKIREHMNGHTDHMIDPGCETFEDYRYCKGIVDGLALSERELLDMDDMLHRSDDD